MSKRMFHVHISVRGVLLNWSDSEFSGVFSHPGGRQMTPREAKAALLDELAKGHEVLPCSDDCEGFDLSGKGCPGHDLPDEAAVFDERPVARIAEPDQSHACPRCDRFHSEELPCVTPADEAWAIFSGDVEGVGAETFDRFGG